MRGSLLTIRELTPDSLGDYPRYFDHDAFADNPAWASCYCNFFLHTHAAQDWETRSAACAGLQRQGMTIAQAYPRDTTAHTAAANYHGPLAMYTHAGFSVFREFDDWLVVRRALT